MEPGHVLELIWYTLAASSAFLHFVSDFFGLSCRVSFRHRFWSTSQQNLGLFPVAALHNAVPMDVCCALTGTLRPRPLLEVRRMIQK